MSAIDKMLEDHKRKSKKAFTLKAGEKKIVRVLPPYDPAYRKKAKALGAFMDPHSGIVQVRAHSWLPRLPLEKMQGKDYYQATNWRCLSDLAKPCPFCSFFDSLDRKEDWQIISKHGSKPKPMIDLYVKDEGKCLRWYMTQQATLERWRDLFDTIPELNDAGKKGRWLLISREGADMTTKYHIKVLKLDEAFDLPEDQYPDDILDEVANYPIIKGPKSCNQVLQAQFPDLL